MKQKSKMSTSRTVLLAAIILMLAFSGTQATRATLSYQSDYYKAETEMQSIDISLIENGQYVDGKDALLQNLKYTDSKGVEQPADKFNYGVTYNENLWVQNTGSIDEYARVIITRYWKDEVNSEAKDVSLDPKMIKLHLLTGGDWLPGEKDGTGSATFSGSDERIILYYNGILTPGQTSSLFMDKMQVDGKLAVVVRQYEENGKIYTEYNYDGAEFVLEVEAQAVQTHNAADAVTSAWGVDAARTLGLASQNSNVNQNTELKEG